VRSRTLKFYEDDVDVSDSESAAGYRHSLIDWLLGFCRAYRLTSADGSAVKASSVVDTSINVSNKLAEAVSVDSSVSSTTNVTTVLELQTDNNTWTEPNAQLNVTYTADMISVLV
jgi:hypothetical protein